MVTFVMQCTLYTHSNITRLVSQQLGPIIKNNYSDIPSSIDDPLLYGSIQQCLMRTRENHAIPAREFLLQVGALHDFGPNTLQLKDNWRMVSIQCSLLKSETDVLGVYVYRTASSIASFSKSTALITHHNSQKPNYSLIGPNHSSTVILVWFRLYQIL